VLNVSCAGARPVALVDCLNFGNPEHAEVMWELSEAIDGISKACLAFDVPVVGGNVSLYNESGGADIDPTPVVGVVGVIDRLDRRPAGIAAKADETLILLGETIPLLAGSRWARELHDETGGILPPLDLANHRHLCEVLRQLVSVHAPAGALVTAVHDVSDGGLALCLAEMAAAGGVGLLAHGVVSPAELFSESPSRVVLCTREPTTLLDAATKSGIPARELGRTGGGRLVIEGLVDLSLEEIIATRSGRLRTAVDLAGR
jgi:phosphoribosylformylglycinamidine synthase